MSIVPSNGPTPSPTLRLHDSLGHSQSSLGEGIVPRGITPASQQDPLIINANATPRPFSELEAHDAWQRARLMRVLSNQWPPNDEQTPPSMDRQNSSPWQNSQSSQSARGSQVGASFQVVPHNQTPSEGDLSPAKGMERQNSQRSSQ